MRGGRCSEWEGEGRGQEKEREGGEEETVNRRNAKGMEGRRKKGRKMRQGKNMREKEGEMRGC